MFAPQEHSDYVRLSIFKLCGKTVFKMAKKLNSTVTFQLFRKHSYNSFSSNILEDVQHMNITFEVFKLCSKTVFEMSKN